jgi:hypothetical protein
MYKVEFKEEAKREQTFWERLRKLPIPRKKHTVIFWDSPEVLPLNRKAAFTRHFTTQLGVGNTYEDYVRHGNKVKGYIDIKDYTSAKQTIDNQNQCIWNALTNYRPKDLAGAVLVYSIDGEVCEHCDDESLKETLQKLTDIEFTFEMMEHAIDLVKKK